MPDQKMRARTSASTYSPFPLLTEETAAMLVKAYIRFIVDSYIACAKEKKKHSSAYASQAQDIRKNEVVGSSEMEQRVRTNLSKFD